MKLALLTLFLCGPMFHAFAELQFPDFTSLPPDFQSVSGYRLHKTYDESLNLELPKAVASFCTGVRINIRDEDGRLISETNLRPPQPSEDGSISISSTLVSRPFTTEIIVYTAAPPGFPTLPNFGGFTFRLPKSEPDKAVDSTATRVTPPAEQVPRHAQP